VGPQLLTLWKVQGQAAPLHIQWPWASLTVPHIPDDLAYTCWFTTRSLLLYQLLGTTMDSACNPYGHLRPGQALSWPSSF
jgi:hypothetical protein